MNLASGPFALFLKVRLRETPKPAGGTPTLPETHPQLLLVNSFELLIDDFASEVNLSFVIFDRLNAR